MTDGSDEKAPSRVVVGIDHSDDSVRAAHWAASEAQARGVPLTIAHALDLHEPGARRHGDKAREQGRGLLDMAAGHLRDAFPGLEVETELSDESPAHALTSLSTASTLVVAGTRGHGGFSGMLVGSVSRKLATHAHGPVVVVRADQPEAKLNEVVVGVEPSEATTPLRYAFAAAQRYGAVVHAVRAWQSESTFATGPDFPDFDDLRDRERRSVEQVIGPLRSSFPEVKVEITAERGNPVPILVESARQTRLLVVGAHRRRGPLSVGAGYTVDGLMEHSPTPVAVVPIH